MHRSWEAAEKTQRQWEEPGLWGQRAWTWVIPVDLCRGSGQFLHLSALHFLVCKVSAQGPLRKAPGRVPIRGSEVRAVTGPLSSRGSARRKQVCAQGCQGSALAATPYASGTPRHCSFLIQPHRTNPKAAPSGLKTWYPGPGGKPAHWIIGKSKTPPRLCKPPAPLLSPHLPSPPLVAVG